MLLSLPCTLWQQPSGVTSILTTGGVVSTDRSAIDKNLARHWDDAQECGNYARLRRLSCFGCLRRLATPGGTAAQRDVSASVHTSYTHVRPQMPVRPSTRACASVLFGVVSEHRNDRGGVTFGVSAVQSLTFQKHYHQIHVRAAVTEPKDCSSMPFASRLSSAAASPIFILMRVTAQCLLADQQPSLRDPSDESRSASSPHVQTMLDHDHGESTSGDSGGASGDEVLLGNTDNSQHSTNSHPEGQASTLLTLLESRVDTSTLDHVARIEQSDSITFFSSTTRSDLRPLMPA